MSSHSGDKPLISQRTHLLFAKFAAFYGHIWRSQFKEDRLFVFAKELWQDTLKEFEDAVFNQAILSCLDFYAMPPTLPQFLQVCRDLQKNIEHNMKKQEDEYVRGSLEVGSHHMNIICAMLGQPLKYPSH